MYNFSNFRSWLFFICSSNNSLFMISIEATIAAFLQIWSWFSPTGHSSGRQSLHSHAVSGTVERWLVGWVGTSPVGLEDVLDRNLTASGWTWLNTKRITSHSIYIVGPEGLHIGFFPLSYNTITTTFKSFDGINRSTSGQITSKSCGFQKNLRVDSFQILFNILFLEKKIFKKLSWLAITILFLCLKKRMEFFQILENYLLD